MSVEKVMRIALLHDWAEVRVGDMPRIATSYFGSEVRKQAETAAFSDIVSEIDADGSYTSLYQEYERRESFEARLVKAADECLPRLRSDAIRGDHVSALEEIAVVKTLGEARNPRLRRAAQAVEQGPIVEVEQRAFDQFAGVAHLAFEPGRPGLRARQLGGDVDPFAAAEPRDLAVDDLLRQLDPRAQVLRVEQIADPDPAPPGLRLVRRTDPAAGGPDLGRLGPILAQASRINFSTRLFNLIVTNVPGPQFPLYVLGRELLDLFPIAFLPRDHAVAIAIMSYNGGIDFGLLGDYDAMPDLDELAADLGVALEELVVAAKKKTKGTTKPRKRASASKS